MRIAIVILLAAANLTGCASFRGSSAPASSYGAAVLDFNYTISGAARWKPTTVYNDGIKTIIQMPPTMSQTEAPTLLIVRSGGGLFSKEELVLVNYRVQRDRYIVDSMFDQAVLLAGVGFGQDRVTITRGK